MDGWLSVLHCHLAAIIETVTCTALVSSVPLHHKIRKPDRSESSSPETGTPAAFKSLTTVVDGGSLRRHEHRASRCTYLHVSQLRRLHGWKSCSFELALITATTAACPTTSRRMTYWDKTLVQHRHLSVLPVIRSRRFTGAFSQQSSASDGLLSGIPQDCSHVRL